MKHYVFDIETSPLPESDILPFCPEFTAPANYKDASKIDDYIAGRKREWIELAALNAITGKVLCIGISSSATSQYVLDSEREEENIRSFWEQFRAGGIWIGWNSNQFDLPFLIRRSWHLGLRVPPELYAGRYFSTKVIDLMQLWGCGVYGERLSLDTAARFMGVGSKNGDGADFATLWATDRPAAYQYLKNDLVLTRSLAERMGVIREQEEEMTV